VDGTHHNAYGSYQLAKCIIEGLRQTDLELGKYVVNDLPRFDPTRPDPVDAFNIPPQPYQRSAKVTGQLMTVLVMNPRSARLRQA
jgi:hypothetical protein